MIGELRRSWHQSDKTSSTKVLDEWIKKEAASEVNMFIRFSKTRAADRPGILAILTSIDYQPDHLNASIKKIKILHKMAYDFRNPDFLN